jgi:hypothetical protein
MTLYIIPVVYYYIPEKAFATEPQRYGEIK